MTLELAVSVICVIVATFGGFVIGKDHGYAAGWTDGWIARARVPVVEEPEDD